MAKASEASAPAAAGRLDSLQGAVKQAGSGRPPIHLWNPPFCGDIDMRIARDGTWFYGGTPIGRPALVRLFASVLKREEDRYVLVTPVEKVGIVVEDAPFVAVELAAEGREPDQVLRLRTNVDDWVTLGPDHPLRFEPGAAEGLKPYVRIRDELWALVSRAVLYELVERGSVQTVNGVAMFGVASNGAFFAAAPADSIDLGS
jgi:uncharacterized protein